MHSFVWNDLAAVPARVPVTLAVPFAAVCARLGFGRAVLSHSGVDLWNWRNGGAVERGDVEGIGLVSSFTRSRDEVGGGSLRV